MPFYAVAKGRKVGIYSTWDKCQQNVQGFSGARFKKFSSQEEAEIFIGQSSDRGKLSVYPRNVKLSQISRAELQTSSSYDFASSSSSSNSYYAVAKGKKEGTFQTWMECQAQVDGYDYPKFRKYSNLREAEGFLEKNKSSSQRVSINNVSQSNKPLLNKLPVRSDKYICQRQPSSVDFRNRNFQQDVNGYVHCYTDGSCESNGRVGAKAGIGVWFGVDHPLNVSKPVTGPPTNNVAEIQAATKAIRLAHESGISKLQINTDSQFLIKSVTQWMPKWQKNGWKLSRGGDVKNKEQLKELNYVLQPDIDIKWNHVKAHKGIKGNEHADMLAKAGAASYKDRTSTSSAVRYRPY